MIDLSIKLIGRGWAEANISDGDKSDKTMDQFKLKFEYEPSPASNCAISIFISVEFNEIRMKDILDIEVFFNSIGTSGILPLFTCTCGNFGCGGYYVEVIHEKNGLIYRNSYAPLDTPERNSMIDNFEFHISWEDVIFLGNQIIDILQEVIKQWPGHEIYSGTFDVIDLSERICVYKKILVGLETELKEEEK